VKPHLIVNPASANGRTGRHFDAIARAVRTAVGDFDCAFTRAPGDGAALAREAARAGAQLVVAVGGDGTASEVVDGLAPGARSDRAATFGFIPRGTGGDLKRTLGWPDDLARAALLLAGGCERVIDLGRVDYVGHDGRPASRHFANVAGFGVAGQVVRAVERAPKVLGGKVAFMVASARALAGWSDQRVRWRADGGPWREERITSVAICNGRYFGGGMMVAPDAQIDDGIFDVTVWKGFGLTDFMVKKGMLYDGTHVRLPNTERLRATVIEAEPAQDEPVLLDVDGEQPGRLPARFTLLPAVLRARVNGAAAGNE
jgi:diacylglycerol kinase (ATP)